MKVALRGNGRYGPIFHSCQDCFCLERKFYEPTMSTLKKRQHHRGTKTANCFWQWLNPAFETLQEVGSTFPKISLRLAWCALTYVCANSTQVSRWTRFFAVPLLPKKKKMWWLQQDVLKLAVISHLIYQHIDLLTASNATIRSRCFDYVLPPPLAAFRYGEWCVRGKERDRNPTLSCVYALTPSVIISPDAALLPSVPLPDLWTLHWRELQPLTPVFHTHVGAPNRDRW